MRREGHVGVGLAGYAPLGFVVAVTGGLWVAAVGAVGVAALSLLPDVDMYLPLGNRRGVTHTVWFAVDVGIVVAGVGGSWASEAGLLPLLAAALVGFVIGTGAIAVHIAADALTPPGVYPLWPLEGPHYVYVVGWATAPTENYLLLSAGSLATTMAIMGGYLIAG